MLITGSEPFLFRGKQFRVHPAENDPVGIENVDQGRQPAGQSLGDQVDGRTSAWIGASPRDHLPRRVRRRFDRRQSGGSQQRGRVGLDLQTAAVSAPAGSFPWRTGVCPISRA